jgi:hypothetical protein
VSYGENFRITWPNEMFELTSSDPEVATINPDGSLRAMGIGSAIIQARLGSLLTHSVVRVVSTRDVQRRLALRSHHLGAEPEFTTR